jgi:hypothetical protein
LKGKGDFELDWKGDDAMAAINAEIKKRANAIGHVLIAAIRKQISKKGTGRIYKTGKKVHQASAPGFPPVIWSGDLHGNIFFRLDEDPIMFYLRVGTDRSYGPRLEFGDSTMAARPWLGRTLDENTGLIKQMLEEKWF